jgi:hypothetical protein
MCGALIRDELETDTLGFLTTRPLSRARLLLIKYLSQTAWLEIWMLVQALLLFAAGSLRQIPALGGLIPLFLAAQFLAVLAWGALGLFLGQVSKRYMALALLYGLIVEMGIGRIPTNINTLHSCVISRHRWVTTQPWKASTIGPRLPLVPLGTGAGGGYLGLAAPSHLRIPSHYGNAKVKRR